MVVPNSRLDRFGFDTWYVERLNPTRFEEHHIRGNSVKVLYETPYDGFTYGCSPKDTMHLLSHVPNDDCYHIEFIIFHQPTRKQIQLDSAWGRLWYYANFGKYGSGPAIYLEAQEINSQIKWSRKLNLEGQAELKRLREDGHLIDETKRDFIITLREKTIRNTVLYRTLLHELGHWAQYDKDFLDEDTALSTDSDVAYELYFAKPQIEHEQFAHRYASEVGDQLRLSGVIPFEALK
ncbi:MAG: hypothetical protein ABJN26_18780 [Stappiaceae bacterium]